MGSKEVIIYDITSTPYKVVLKDEIPEISSDKPRNKLIFPFKLGESPVLEIFFGC